MRCNAKDINPIPKALHIYQMSKFVLCTMHIHYVGKQIPIDLSKYIYTIYAYI